MPCISTPLQSMGAGHALVVQMSLLACSGWPNSMHRDLSGPVSRDTARPYRAIPRDHLRKILAPIKIKSALPPPKKKPKIPSPPQNEEFLWTWFFLQNGHIFPGVHKIGATISGPRIADKNLTDTRIFLTISAIPPSHCAPWGFLVSQHGQSGAIPPPPFLSFSPLESMRSGGARYPPPPLERGISAIPYEN